MWKKEMADTPTEYRLPGRGNGPWKPKGSHLRNIRSGLMSYEEVLFTEGPWGKKDQRSSDSNAKSGAIKKAQNEGSLTICM